MGTSTPGEQGPPVCGTRQTVIPESDLGRAPGASGAPVPAAIEESAVGTPSTG
jgi:hypothetical protein